MTAWQTYFVSCSSWIDLAANLILQIVLISFTLPHPQEITQSRSKSLRYPCQAERKTRTWTRVTKALGTRLLCTINQLRQQCPFFHTVFCVIIINHAYFPASNIETNLMNYKNNYKKKEKKNIMISLATYRNVLANLFSPIFFQFWKRNLKKPKIPIPNERFSNLIR